MKQTIFVSAQLPVYFKFFPLCYKLFSIEFWLDAVNRTDSPVVHTFICTERFWDVDVKEARAETVKVQLYIYIDIFPGISEFRQGSTGFGKSLGFSSVAGLQFRNINIEREKSPIYQETLPIYYVGKYSNSQGLHKSNNLPFVIKTLYFRMMLNFAMPIKPLKQYAHTIAGPKLLNAFRVASFTLEAFSLISK